MTADTPLIAVADATVEGTRAPRAGVPAGTRVAMADSDPAPCTSVERRSDQSQHPVGPSIARRKLVGLTLGAWAASAGTGLVASQAQAQAPTDSDILNFLLNLEYLVAEFYSRAVFGTGLPPTVTGGAGVEGMVTGGAKNSFTDPVLPAYAREIAQDHIAHVNFLRGALGTAAVAEPSIDISAAGTFTTIAIAAGLIVPGQTFNPYADDVGFILGAYFFNDVMVSAYQGALSLITSINKPYIAAAAGILAVEAYHAAIVRAEIFIIGGGQPANAISNLRATLSGKPDDQGVLIQGGEAVVTFDQNGATYGRTPGQVLNIFYGAQNATSGLFFPNGVNGTIKAGMTPTS